MRAGMFMLKIGKDKHFRTNGGKGQKRRQYNETESFTHCVCHRKIVIKRALMCKRGAALHSGR